MQVILESGVKTTLREGQYIHRGGIFGHNFKVVLSGSFLEEAGVHERLAFSFPTFRCASRISTVRQESSPIPSFGGRKLRKDRIRE